MFLSNFFFFFPPNILPLLQLYMKIKHTQSCKVDSQGQGLLLPVLSPSTTGLSKD